MSFTSETANLALESRDIILSLLDDSDPAVDEKSGILKKDSEFQKRAAGL